MSTNNKTSILEKFTHISETLVNPSLARFREDGGRVVGYFCSVMPEELLIAGGLMPFRMRGNMSRGTDNADVYFTSWNCSFPRHCFNLALLGEFNFLDGLVVAGTCDTIRFVFDNWKKSPVKTPFIHLLNVPHVSGEPMVDYFRGELAKLRLALETSFGITITDDKVWDAVRLCNRTRELQQAIYALRKSDHPPISGSEMVQVMVAGASMPKEEYNDDLETLLNSLKSSIDDSRTYDARLLVVGSGGDDTIITQIAEEMNAVVVNDHTCFGGKVKYGTISETGGDPLEAIAKYQVLDRPFCPKIGGAYQLRLDVILNLIKEYRIDGMIGQRMGCCDSWSGELYSLRTDLKSEGIPSMILERDYIPDSIGQISTRIQAFIETIRR